MMKMLLLFVGLLSISIQKCWGSPPPDYKDRANFDSSWNATSNVKSQKWENEWEYVDLAFKIDYTALNGPGQHLLNGVFLGHTIARETFATQFILDVHRAVNVSTDRLYVHNVTPATHHYEHVSRYVMVMFRMYSVGNATEDFKFSASGGSRGDKNLNSAYSRGGGYEEDLERMNDIGSADPTPNMGYHGDLSTVEALAELSDQAQNKDSILIRLGNVTRAVDPQWGLVALDWDVSLKVAYTVGVIDGSIPKSEAYVSDPTLNRFAGGGGSGEGSATGEVEEFSDVLWLNQGADRYCQQEEGASLSYSLRRKERSAYCEFEYLFRTDVATALNVTTSRVLLLLIKSASRDHSLVYFRLLPPADGNETSTAFLVADLQDQALNLDSSLYNGNVTVRTDSSWGVSGFGGRVRKRSPYLPYSISESSFAHSSSYERCKLTQRCPRGREVYNVSNGEKRFSYQAFNGGRNYELSSNAFLLDDATWAEAKGKDPLKLQARLDELERVTSLYHEMTGGMLGGSGGRAGLFADFEDARVGTHGWRQRGGPPPISDKRPPHGAHFSPFSFETLGPSVPIPQPFGRKSGGGSGASRQSQDGSVTDLHIEYTQQDFDYFQNRGLILNNRTFARDLETQREVLSILKNDLEWHILNRKSALLDAELRSREDVERFMTKRINLISRRIEAEEKKYHKLSHSQCALQDPISNHIGGCRLLFNTSAVSLIGLHNETIYGEVALTKQGTPVAVFTFDSIEIGPEVNVTLVGQRALLLLSRSSVLINTTFQVEPGTLGGFPGGYSWGRSPSDLLSDEPKDVLLRHLPSMHATAVENSGVGNHPDIDLDKGLYRSSFSATGGLGYDSYSHDASTHKGNETTASNNVNGPGSGNVRNYQYTVTTSAEDIDEIQVITTSCDEGQQLGGWFTLKYLKKLNSDDESLFTSQRIPWDASASHIQMIIEADLNAKVDEQVASFNSVSEVDHKSGVGSVRVSRHAMQDTGGYSWSVTFTSATGNVPLLGCDFSDLSGIGAKVEIETLREGNSISGSFQLSMFGLRTGPIAHDSSAQDMKRILEQDLSPLLLRAHVWRSDETSVSSNLNHEYALPMNSKCNDGRCLHGPTAGGGFTWTLLLTTQEGNVSPTSPTCAEAWKQAKRHHLTHFGSLVGEGVELAIQEGHDLSNLSNLQKFSVKEPFSLAYGGGGGGYGGRGGGSFNESNPTTSAQSQSPMYGDASISDLVGGSGGQMGYLSPQDIATFTSPTSRGGAGGGAIEIVAVNDLVIGSYGGLSVNGGRGQDGHMGGGGGGSGGSLLLVAGGSVHLEGGALLECRGGDGGRTGGQVARSSQTYQRMYGGDDKEFIASSFSSEEGGAVPATLTAKQERMLANLAKTTRGKGKPNSGVSTRHIASMRASMVKGMSFTDAHKKANEEEDTAQEKAEIKTAVVERSGGGGGGGRIAIFAHSVSLATQRALFKRDREYGPIEYDSLLNGGGLTGSYGGKSVNHYLNTPFYNKDAYGNGGDGGERIDSSWRLHDGSRGSGSNQPGRPYSVGSDGTRRGTGNGYGGYAVYDIGGGRCVTRQKSIGPQNGTWFDASVNGTNSSFMMNETLGSTVYLGPNETAYMCSRQRQGDGGSFHIEIDVGVAVQVVERGIDDYSDAVNENVTSGAGMDFDRFSGGNGGAQGTSRSMRLDSANLERVITASGVMQRRAYPFQGLEHDILGAQPSSTAMKLSKEIAHEKKILANQLRSNSDFINNSTSYSVENKTYAKRLAEQAEQSALLAEKVSEDTYRGSHKPSRISFYLKINGSDFINDRSDGGFTTAHPSKRKQGSWGALIALHSADYGQRSGYNKRNGGEKDMRNNTSSSSSSTSDPYEAAGYFKHHIPGMSYNTMGVKREGGFGATGFSHTNNVENTTYDFFNSTNSSYQNRKEESIPRVLMGLSVGSEMRHGTDFLISPNELISGLEGEEINPIGSSHRRTKSGGMHESVVGDGLLDNLPVFDNHVQEHRWYKIDIFIDWDRRQYSIRVDDERKVTAPFSVEHDHILRLGVYTINTATVWIDEIYVGPDLSRQFETPYIKGTGADMSRPRQSNGWTSDDIGGVTTNHEMQRHESHLSKRQVYSFDKTFNDWNSTSSSANNDTSNSGGKAKLIPFDGDGHRKFHSDIKERRPRGFMHHTESVSDIEGDYGHGADGGGLPANLHAGSLLYVKGHRTSNSLLNRAYTSYTNDQSTSSDGQTPQEVGQTWSNSQQDRKSNYKGYLDGSSDLKTPNNVHTTGSSGRYYWYGEHFKGPSGEAADGSGVGGIFCMSSNDMTTWRNEGLMLDFRNLTDMVNGLPPVGAKLVADRPKVIFNNKTQLYVMYMHLEYAHDTDPSEDNSAGGYSRIYSSISNNENESDISGSFAFQNTKINSEADGNTLSANGDMVGGGRYPSSNSEWALLRQKEAHRLGQLDNYAGLSTSRLDQRSHGTDGGLIEAGSTIGTSPDGHGISIKATSHGDGDRYYIPTHSDRGVDGLGSGVGEGEDKERGHYQEHNWIRRDSLRGNWSGSQLGMAAIATSKWPNGPFLFRRSFYPDGNKTKDQTLFGHPAGEVSKKASQGKQAQGSFSQDEEDEVAFLGRTYYANVEYIMPKAVMQPIWESVKHEDGSINYALSYHRSFYESEYDKFHDIFLQRWRHEDKKWKVICVNRTDGSIREVPRESSGGWAQKAASSTPDAVWELPTGAVCFQPDEYKVVVGQGWPAIRSRFLDPRDPKNNVWRPNSVPSVQAQDWWNNYRRGACGRRKLDDDLSPNDILLELGFPNITESERRHCTDIADNPLHPTLSDILMGPLAVAETRRSKYVAFSSLTEDFMDTTGSLHSFEGELEDEKDMISLLTQFGNQFWHDQTMSKKSSKLSSTFHPPITTQHEESPSKMEMSPDYETRMHQYEMHPGDRSDFSLACVLDGTCSVNFRDQVEHSPRANGEPGGEFDTLQGSPTSGSQDFRSSFTGR